MISWPLFKQTIKSNIKYFIIFTLVVCVFMIAMCALFTPTTVSGLHDVTKGSAIGNIINSDGTLISFMSNSFYVLMAIIFPMVYSIMVGNRLIAEKIDRGTMTCLLSTPTTRKQITITSALYFITSLLLMWSIASVVGLVAAHIFQPGALDIEIFITMNIGCFLYHLVISGICFFFSCFCNFSRTSLTFGAGIPLFFFVDNLLLKLSSDIEILKYFTLNTLFDTKDILQGSGYLSSFIIMLVIGIILYCLGILVFEKKDLPL